MASWLISYYHKFYHYGYCDYYYYYYWYCVKRTEVFDFWLDDVVYPIDNGHRYLVKYIPIVYSKERQSAREKNLETQQIHLFRIWQYTMMEGISSSHHHYSFVSFLLGKVVWTRMKIANPPYFPHNRHLWNSGAFQWHLSALSLLQHLF